MCSSHYVSVLTYDLDDSIKSMFLQSYSLQPIKFLKYNIHKVENKGN